MYGVGGCTVKRKRLVRGLSESDTQYNIEDVGEILFGSNWVLGVSTSFLCKAK